MKIKTSELTGAALDWAVNQIEECCDDPCAPLFSTNWTQGGPIIEREKIELTYYMDGGHENGGEWLATRIGGPAVSEEWGPTPLIAAMRCFVASRLGDEVEIPEELK